MATGVLGRLARRREPAEAGVKDTVTRLPRRDHAHLKATLRSSPACTSWHCHIVEHEDNEMMRPYAVGPIPVRRDRRIIHARGGTLAWSPGCGLPARDRMGRSS